jgi:hypothetical protein
MASIKSLKGDFDQLHRPRRTRSPASGVPSCWWQRWLRRISIYKMGTISSNLSAGCLNRSILGLMNVEQHRAARHKVIARAEVVDVDEERQLTARTGNLSVFGCFIETGTPFPSGTKIRLRINHRGATFVALGQVVDCRSDGMGIRFVEIEPAHQQILEAWLARLRCGQ